MQSFEIESEDKEAKSSSRGFLVMFWKLVKAVDKVKVIAVKADVSCKAEKVKKANMFVQPDQA